MQRLSEDQKKQFTRIMKFIPEFKGFADHDLIKTVSQAEDELFKLQREISGSSEEESDDEVSDGTKAYIEFRSGNQNANPLAGKPLAK